MSKKKKIFIAALVVVFILCGSTSALLVLYHFDEANAYITEPVSQSWNLQIEQGGAFSLDCSYNTHIDVDIVTHSGNTVLITFEGTKGYGASSESAPGIEAVEHNRGVAVRAVESPTRFYIAFMSIGNLGSSFMQGKLTVSLPKDHDGDIDIHTPAMLNMDGVTGGMVSLNAQEVTTKNVKFEELDITANGSLTMDNCTISGSINLRGWGDAEMTNIRGDSLDMSTLDNDTALSNSEFTGDVEIDTWHQGLRLENIRCKNLSVRGNSDPTIVNCTVQEKLFLGDIYSLICTGTAAAEVEFSSTGDVTFTNLATDRLYGNDFYGMVTASLVRPADIDIQSFGGGGVDLTLPKDMGFKLSVGSNYSGDIDLGYALMHIETDYNSISGTVGDGAYTIEIEVYDKVSINPAE